MVRTGLVKMSYATPVTHLRAWREAAGLSQGRLAELAGRDRTAIWKAETARQCGGNVARSLHEITGVPLKDLLSMEVRTQWTVELRPPSSSRAEAEQEG